MTGISRALANIDSKKAMGRGGLEKTNKHTVHIENALSIQHNKVTLQNGVTCNLQKNMPTCKKHANLFVYLVHVR